MLIFFYPRDSIGFTCTKKSGVIRASDGIDSSKYTYLLYIKAIDGGDPKLSTFTEVLVRPFNKKINTLSLYRRTGKKIEIINKRNM